MSRLDELIQKLCPNGVEYKQIGNIATVRIGEFVHKNKQNDSAPYPVYNGGISNTGYYEEYNNTANKIIISARGANAGFVNKVIENYWAGNSCYTVDVVEKDVNWNFVYYALKNWQNRFLDQQQKGGIPAVSKKQVEQFIIPVPPLEVQCEIVRILDNFTLLTAELTAELTARKKQYEYYRDELLTFGGNTMSTVKLSDVAHYSADRIEACLLNETNYVGVDNLLPNKQGKTLSNYVPTEGRLTQFNNEDILIGNIRPYLKKIWLSDTIGGTNGDVLTIQVNDIKRILPKYLYYILSSEEFFHYDTQNSKGAKMPRGDKEMVMKYEFYLPAREEQERIVSILDRFDTLCNDISEGIPAEIEARQKQYEYYRDKLLTFKEKFA